MNNIPAVSDIFAAYSAATSIARTETISRSPTGRTAPAAKRDERLGPFGGGGELDLEGVAGNDLDDRAEVAATKASFRNVAIQRHGIEPLEQEPTSGMRRRCARHPANSADAPGRSNGGGPARRSGQNDLDIEFLARGQSLVQVALSA